MSKEKGNEPVLPMYTQTDYEEDVDDVHSDDQAAKEEFLKELATIPPAED